MGSKITIKLLGVVAIGIVAVGRTILGTKVVKNTLYSKSNK